MSPLEFEFDEDVEAGKHYQTAMFETRIKSPHVTSGTVFSEAGMVKELYFFMCDERHNSFITMALNDARIEVLNFEFDPSAPSYLDPL